MTKRILTQKRLKELFEYSPHTGLFLRLVAVNYNAKKGYYAGSISGGYMAIRIDSALYLSHRLAWLYMTGEFPDNEIDHINHNKFDNRWINIRAVSHADNMRNQPIRKNNTSGLFGVYWTKRDKKWFVQIELPNKCINLGRYSSFFDAACARKSAEIKYGFHANHGINSK